MGLKKWEPLVGNMAPLLSSQYDMLCLRLGKKSPAFGLGKPLEIPLDKLKNVTRGFTETKRETVYSRKV